MEKRDNKNKKKNDKIKSSTFWYLVLMLGCAILRKGKNGTSQQTEEFKNQKKKKGAMLVLANHVSAYDFCYFTPPFFGKKVNFVVAENMMYSKPIYAKLIKKYKTITKKQYFADFQCIKNIKKYLDSGISVILCPEGKVAADGKTGVIMDSTARLVQWLGYPVATVVTKGGGLVRPKWARSNRKGKVLSVCDMLFSAEELKKMKRQEIQKSIEKALNHNEHIYQIEHQNYYEGDGYAIGLERILYYCPKCGKEFFMDTFDDKIKCQNCGNEVVYKHTGELVPNGENSMCFERIDLWYEKQKQLVIKELQNDDFRISNPVNLFIENPLKNGYRFIASGKISLDKKYLKFDSNQEKRPKYVESDYKISAMDYDVENREGEMEDVEEEFKHLSFPVKNFDTIANIPGDSLDIYDEKHTYRMMFSKQKASTKYLLAIEEMFKIRTKKK